MKSDNIGKKILRTINSQKAGAALILLFVIMPFLNEYFLTAYNMAEILIQTSILAILAFGVTFVIIAGDCDLSIGSMMCLGGIIAIQLQPYLPLPLILLVVLLIGALVGAINAFLVVNQKAESFITTLGMGMLLKGICLVFTDAHPISGTNDTYTLIGNGKLLGVPYIAIIALAVLLVSFLVLSRTSFGRNCYAVGGDYEVAKYSGIKVDVTKWLTFIICGVTAALGGFLLSARLNSGSATYGETTALMVNCSVVIGGTPFSGGVGGVFRTLLGIFFIGTLETSMNLMNINSYIQMLIKGGIIVLIVGLDCLARKRKREAV